MQQAGYRYGPGLFQLRPLATAVLKDSVPVIFPMRSFLLWSLLLAIIAVLAVGGWFGLYVTTPAPGSEQITVVIPKGAGVRRIKQILGEQGVIRDDVRFLLLVRLTEEGRRLRAGEFQIPPGLTPLEVLRFLESAKPVQYRITIPEGWTMQQTAAAFAREQWVDAETFLRLCRDRTFIKELGIAADSLEGYLFPETYSLVRGEVDERSLVTTMVRRFFTVWDGLAKPEVLPLDQHQLLTLASIVEKETGSAGERARIAGVFYNRLHKGMRLQSDPTTIYGLKDFDGNLTRADLKEATPYNTYVIPGLPPGPICSPGRAALQAVLQPEEVPYFYFVSKNDGSHFFSRSLKEHNRAVYKYQKSRKKGKP